MFKPAEIIKDLLRRDNYLKKNDTNDLVSYLLIQDLIKFPDFFPITTSSIKFHTLASILNDIILNKPQNCIEFGSGISTLAIARLLRNNKLDCDFFSIEDNIEWFNFIKSFVLKNNLQEYIKLVYAPLEKTNLALDNNGWYALKALEENITADTRFSLAIIDGPGAWKPEIKLSRYTAIPYLINRLNDSFSIYLDDVNRKGEKKILQLWNKNYKMKFQLINDTAAVFVKGNRLNTIL